MGKSARLWHTAARTTQCKSTALSPLLRFQRHPPIRRGQVIGALAQSAPGSVVACCCGFRRGRAPTVVNVALNMLFISLSVGAFGVLHSWCRRLIVDLVLSRRDRIHDEACGRVLRRVRQQLGEGPLQCYAVLSVHGAPLRLRSFLTSRRGADCQVRLVRARFAITRLGMASGIEYRRGDLS